MKKVININFQGRVVPIEETAYDLLKQYLDSLRVYFAREEGKDEIINDIENRIGELFTERLKSGQTCITDADVQAVIVNMGRPEDFDAQAGETQAEPQQPGAGQSSFRKTSGRGPLFRNADDKILGGVCSGLANYLSIDPIIMRILFVALFGALFWVYILLWIIVPSRSVQSNITKRLYRSADHRVVGGVAAGIAAYFNIDVWIPRLVFAFPFIIGLISGSFHSWWWDWDPGFLPRVISGSFGWTLFITYVILWIAVPVANTSTERLEMRGEKVDLNSIANTVKEDLNQFKEKAKTWGSEVQVTAKQYGNQAAAEFRTAGRQAGQAVSRSRSGLGHAIGVLVKAFLIFIFAIIALSLFAAFIGLLFSGLALAPLKEFVLEGPLQNSLAWATLFLFFLLPLIALLTWLIRRIMGVRSRKHYVGFTFAGLWILGLISGILLIVLVVKNFKSTGRLEEEPVAFEQPAQKLIVNVERSDWKDQDRLFFGMEVNDNDFPFYQTSDDSVWMNTVKISMIRSADSLYHVYLVRASQGRSQSVAKENARQIQFDVIAQDSTILLPKGFVLGNHEKFRNQRVWVVVEIPVGKRVAFSRNIDQYKWFNLRSEHNGYDGDNEWDEWNNMYRPRPGIEYIMQSDGHPEEVRDFEKQSTDTSIDTVPPVSNVQ